MSTRGETVWSLAAHSAWGLTNISGRSPRSSRDRGWVLARPYAGNQLGTSESSSKRPPMSPLRKSRRTQRTTPSSAACAEGWVAGLSPTEAPRRSARLAPFRSRTSPKTAPSAPRRLRRFHRTVMASMTWSAMSGNGRSTGTRPDTRPTPPRHAASRKIRVAAARKPATTLASRTSRFRARY